MTTWKLVPVEPTHNMILAGSLDSRMTPSMANSSYKAMLNSAPAPDVQPAIYPEEARQMGLEEVAYYTHPPAPQLRPLTEDETMHLMNETAGRQHWADEAHIQRFRQAVERAHGIGEGKI
jgi:hypothetical protein